MSNWECLKLQDFLTLHPSIRLIELNAKQVVLEGDYEIDAQMQGFAPILCTYQLQMVFPTDYPRSLPTIRESENTIPRTADYHTYGDGSFCLGSDIKLKSILFEYPAVTEFVQKILDPFLYAITYKVKHDIFPFGDLDHGEAGLIDDYQRLFSVKGKAAVLLVMAALGKRKREANKLPCPCGCKRRLGKCEFRFGLQRWRQLDTRHWFREHISNFTPVKKSRKSKMSQKKGQYEFRKRKVAREKEMGS